MKLHDHILHSVYSYPLLYLRPVFEESRLLVLHQCFLVLGNGMEWAETGDPATGGYMVHPKSRRTYGEWRRLPDAAYGKRRFRMEWGDLMGHGITDFLEGGNDMCPGSVLRLIRKEKQKEVTAGRFYARLDRRPYPFSATRWPFAQIEPSFIQLDWRQGMIDVKRWALDYYENKWAPDIAFGDQNEKQRAGQIKHLKHAIGILESLNQPTPPAAE